MLVLFTVIKVRNRLMFFHQKIVIFFCSNLIHWKICARVIFLGSNLIHKNSHPYQIMIWMVVHPMWWHSWKSHRGAFLEIMWVRFTLEKMKLLGRGVARYKMKCRHNLRRGVWGRLWPPAYDPSRSRGEPWWGVQGGEDPQRKTILSVNRCTNGEIWTIKDMKYSYFIMETIQKSKLLIYFCWIWELLTECFYTAFQNNLNSYTNSASQSIESIAKIIINAICMKETFPETFKE